MSTDPVQLSDISAALPDEADYDAIYAELVTTPRGRWFLREYASRNRHADTHMLVGALARVEAAVRGDPLPQIPAALAREFGDLAAAIGRIEAEIAATGMPAGDGLAAAAAGAAERIQDVAFALREREVDAALCDALEAAIGEVGAAFTRSDAAAERAQSAAALLRELSGRIDALIAHAVAGAGAEPLAVADAAQSAAVDDEAEEEAAGEDTAVAGTPVMERSAAQAREDEFFAAAIGALAASFPPPADAGEADREPQDEGAATAAAAATVLAAPDHGNEVEPASGEPVAAALGVAAETERIEPAEVEREQAAEDVAAEDVAAEDVAAEHVAAEHVAGEHVASEHAAAEQGADNLATDVDAQDAIAELLGAVATPVIDDIRAPAAGETEALSVATLPANEAEPPHNNDAGDAEGVEEPANIAPTSEVILIATPASEMPANEAFSGQDLTSEDLASEELAREELASEELASEQSSNEELAGEELPSEALPSEESPSEEWPSAQSPSAAASPEQSSSEAAPGEGAFCPPEAAEPINQPPQHPAAHADIAAVHPLGSEPAGDDAEWFHDTVAETAAEATAETAVEPMIEVAQAAAADAGEGGSRLDTEPAHPLLPAAQTPAGPAGPEEDPGDLFDAMTLPIPSPQSTLPAEQAAAAPAEIAANLEDSKQITHSSNADDTDRGRADAGALAAGALSRQRTAARADAARAPAPALAAPASTQVELPLEQPSQPRAAATPVARAMSRPAASDPLASVRALSEEELIALFS